MKCARSSSRSFYRYSVIAALCVLSLRNLARNRRTNEGAPKQPTPIPRSLEVPILRNGDDGINGDNMSRSLEVPILQNGDGGTNGDNSEADPKEMEIRPSFRFPSPGERIDYYMGGWHHRNFTLATDAEIEEVCSKLEVNARVETGIIFKDVLYTVQNIIHQVQTNSFRSVPYLGDALKVMNTAPALSSNQALALRIGDVQSEQHSIPIIGKTRMSGSKTEEAGARAPPGPIVWPLNFERHFEAPLAEYAALRRRGGVAKWRDKRDTLLFRGAFTGVRPLMQNPKRTPFEYGPRAQAAIATAAIVTSEHGLNSSHVDFGFDKVNGSYPSMDDGYYSSKFGDYVKGRMSMKNQLKYKYIWSIEGNDVASGLKWQLASNSVVFMAKPDTVSWAMEDLLVPFVHYVPLKDDFSDVLEMIEWARAHDDLCKWISQQATEYMNRLWISEEAKVNHDAVVKALAWRYQDRFGPALQKCVRREHAANSDASNSIVRDVTVTQPPSDHGNGSTPPTQDDDYDDKCIRSDEELESLIAQASGQLTAITMPSKAAGRSMIAFTKKCFDRPDIGGNTIFNPDHIKNSLLSGKDLLLPRVLASHMSDGEMLQRVVAQLPFDSLVVYIHRNEKERIVSAVKHVYKELENRGGLDWCNVRYDKAARTCVVDQDSLASTIQNKPLEIKNGDSQILTCGTYDAIEKNAPNMIFANYKEADKLQRMLAKYHCPHLLGRAAVRDNVDEEKHHKVLVQMQKEPEVLVDLGEWLEAKADILSLAFSLQDAMGCQGKTREMEGRLFGCLTGFVRA